MARISLVLIAALALGACANVASTDPDRPAPREREGRVAPSNASTVRITNEASVEELRLTRSPEAVFGVLEAVFDELEIPVRHLEPQDREIGTVNWNVPPRIDGRRPSTYLDCGESRTGHNANTMEVRLDMTVTVEPAEDGGSRMITQLDGQAAPRFTTGQEGAHCASTGELEFLLLGTVRAHLDGG